MSNMVSTIHERLQASVYKQVRVIRDDEARTIVEGNLVSTRSDTYRVKSQEFHLIDVLAVAITGIREPHAIIILN